ncbi:DUF4190 domain-containing protein [Streptomyces sp. MUM 203J]|uniref:DUF4190 domain-containing protein n=1 Tax=Streptomyces sp. MUM 203J TaxID=2791990 RepID=UPI001F03EE03|nr:DUF4190 domain-containing protein [Streptomyces sp. MUM 203J]MCH0538334.1 DUF4190 domain-containing protein [Streptomyces sp. MUM 203J]
MSHLQTPPPPPAPEPVQPKGNGLAVAGLVLGILALVFSFIPIVNVIVWPLAILGVIFGAIGLAKSGKAGKGKGASITALITSALAVVLFFVMNALLFAAVDEAVKETQKELDKSYDSAEIDKDGKAKGSGDNAVLKDFTVAKCEVMKDEFDLKELALHVDYTNNGDRRYSYLLEGEVLVDGKKVSDFLSTAENLEPKQKYTDEDAGVLVDADKIADGKTPECKVVKASRNDF